MSGVAASPTAGSRPIYQKVSKGLFSNQVTWECEISRAEGDAAAVTGVEVVQAVTTGSVLAAWGFPTRARNVTV